MLKFSDKLCRPLVISIRASESAVPIVLLGVDVGVGFMLAFCILLKNRKRKKSPLLCITVASITVR